MTASLGLSRVAGLREGDTVLVSGAAGAVGAAVGQIARRLGAARVISSAGSTERTTALTQKYGYDVALNDKDAPIREELVRAVGEDRVDVFFDNVGGDHLEAFLAMVRGDNRGKMVVRLG
jgi:hypothetical protein